MDVLDFPNKMSINVLSFFVDCGANSLLCLHWGQVQTEICLYTATFKGPLREARKSLRDEICEKEKNSDQYRSNCHKWASHGYCLNKYFKDFMQENCSRSCCKRHGVLY